MQRSYIFAITFYVKYLRIGNHDSPRTGGVEVEAKTNSEVEIQVADDNMNLLLLRNWTYKVARTGQVKTLGRNMYRYQDLEKQERRDLLLWAENALLQVELFH